MTEIGQVKATRGEKVVLQMVRNPACGSCRACSMGLEDKAMELTALNLCQAKAGDMVEIKLERDRFLSAVSVLYGIPLVSLLVGMVLGYLLGRQMQIMQTEGMAIICGLALMLASFVLIRSQEKKFKGHKFLPKATKIIK